ncbi:MAG: hypothetical protein V3R94_01070 [Acidobacteriota bacterium]
MNERQLCDESRTTKPAVLSCHRCRERETYQLQWLVRRKKKKLPPNANEEMRRHFDKFESYMVLIDDVVVCNRCRSRIEVSGMKTMAYLTDEPSGSHDDESFNR